MCIPQFLLGEDEKSKKVTALLTNGISCCIFAAHLKLSSMNTNQNEIILYQPNESIKLDVRIEHETVWLTQAQMVILFQSTKQNISLHVNNIFKENELEYQTTVKEYLTVQKEGLLLSKRLPKVCTIIYTKQISPQLQLDLTKHNTQYEPINIYQSDNFHDRFLIIDDVVYHIGASLKDLGKKLFAFSKMKIKTSTLLCVCY